MFELNYIKAIEKLEKGENSFPVVVIFGFNEFLGEDIIALLSKKIIDKKNDFNFQRFYFEKESNLTWQELIDELKTSSFFVESKKIIIATIRDTKSFKVNEKEVQLLKDYFLNPNKNAIFVIYFSLNLSKDDYKIYYSREIKKFLSNFKDCKNILSVNLDNVREYEFKKRIREYFAKRNISITNEALDKIIDLKGENYLSFIPQLEKIEVVRKSKNTVDSEDIENNITGLNPHSIWDLSDSLEKIDVKRYLETLNYFFLNSVSPSLIIGTLITNYHRIFTAKFLLKHNYPAKDIGRLLNQPSYFLNQFLNKVKSLNDKKLTKILNLIYKLDYVSKTGGEEHTRLLLQNLIFEIKIIS